MLSTQDRQSIQESFCLGNTKVEVATVAFGMGVGAQGLGTQGVRGSGQLS